jgi:hypothetical protein
MTEEITAPTRLKTIAGGIVSDAGLAPAAIGTIWDFLKGLFSQLLGGLCPTPTPAALHARLTGTAQWDERPSSLDDRRQRNQLIRSAGGRFHPDVAEYVLDATWTAKMALTEEDCAAIIAEHGR